MTESLSRPRSVAPAIVFIATLLVVFGTTAVVIFRQPKLYAGTVYIKFQPIIPPETKARQAELIAPDLPFLRSQFEVMRSQVVLERVVKSLDLSTEWGKRFAGGERLKTAETLALLSRQIEFQNSPDPGQMIVHIFSESPEEAAKIANAMAKAYLQYRMEWQRGLINADVDRLQQEYDSEAQGVEAIEIEEKKLRSDFGFTDADLTNRTEALPILPEMRQLQGEYIAAQAALAEQIIILTNVLNVSAESQRQVLKTALSANDKLQARLNETNKLNGESVGRTDPRVQIVLTELSNRVTTLQQAVANANAGLQDAKSNAVAYAEAAQRFAEIAPNVKRRSAIAGVIGKKKAALAALKSDVEIVEEATPAKKPARPDLARNLGYGAVAGLILALGAGWIATRFSS